MTDQVRGRSADARRRAIRIAAEHGPAAAGATGTLLPPRATSSGTLRRLQEEALRQFATRGYHGVSVRDLAGAIGIHPSSVYAHVTSKQQLLTELIRLGHEEQSERLVGAVAAAGDDPVAQVTAMIGELVRVHADYPLLMRVTNRELEALSPTARAAAYEARVRAEQLAVEIIVRGRERGLFGDSEPLLAMTALGSMGIRVAEWWRPELGIDVDELADTYATFARKLLG
ncbi:HTH-type transcriptional repressor KstR2 [Nocardia otitidiscaviarum]|uniref:HTH-type transcriptional repressor KstR2 n=1 Tax=Nocardia otitidiscaviarum TaxID=1823 RepID=A0A379JI44_9NOCA|nr:TetR/AcrR family transcriptional regulator [Nocardia otitidiscaviarum]MBF6239632.1 TetR family transcriptional regulator [Nocardia otitidiscaviarum]SUD48188.1 HTH-type transcriptional repressor KstR2 [Nocardia otitidiscaviarum]